MLKKKLKKETLHCSDLIWKPVFSSHLSLNSSCHTLYCMMSDGEEECHIHLKEVITQHLSLFSSVEGNTKWRSNTDSN